MKDDFWRGFDLIKLPCLLYVFRETDISKQYRPRSDAAFCLPLFQQFNVYTTSLYVNATLQRYEVYTSHSNTPRLYSQYILTLGGSARRYMAPFWRHFDTLLTSVCISTTLDGETSVFSVNTVWNASKRQRYSQNCLWDFFIRWREVGRIWRIQLLFRRFFMC